MKPAVSIAVEGLEDGWVTMMTRGRSTSRVSQTVSTFDTLWRGRQRPDMAVDDDNNVTKHKCTTV